VLVVHVHVQVKPEWVAEFLGATQTNARASAREPGILRFDVLQDADDETHVVLVEVYRDAEAPAAHKQTVHYAAWRDAVEKMLAAPRHSTTFSAVFPAGAGQWTSPPP
jgi:autoinducer 2-degrading protein